MTESEYIIATNLAKIRSAKSILSDVLAGKPFGIPETPWRKMLRSLAALENDLSKQVQIKLDDED